MRARVPPKTEPHPSVEVVQRKGRAGVVREHEIHVHPDPARPGVCGMGGAGENGGGGICRCH